MSEYFEAKIWMKSKQGENDYSMFINEQPEGGFKWSFLDFDPEDEVNYKSLIVHNFTLADIEEIEKVITHLKKEIEELKSLIKEAIPHVKKSLDSIFEIDLRFSHMVKNKEACEKWLEKAEKIK